MVSGEPLANFEFDSWTGPGGGGGGGSGMFGDELNPFRGDRFSRGQTYCVASYRLTRGPKGGHIGRGNWEGGGGGGYCCSRVHLGVAVHVPTLGQRGGACQGPLAPALTACLCLVAAVAAVVVRVFCSLDILWEYISRTGSVCLCFGDCPRV